MYMIFYMAEAAYVQLQTQQKNMVFRVRNPEAFLEVTLTEPHPRVKVCVVVVVELVAV